MVLSLTWPASYVSVAQLFSVFKCCDHVEFRDTEQISLLATTNQLIPFVPSSCSRTLFPKPSLNWTILAQQACKANCLKLAVATGLLRDKEKAQSLGASSELPLFLVKLFPQSLFLIILPKGPISEKGFLNFQTPSRLKLRRLKRCDMHASLSLPHLSLLTHPCLSTAWFCRGMKGVGRVGMLKTKPFFWVPFLPERMTYEGSNFLSWHSPGTVPDDWILI